MKFIAPSIHHKSFTCPHCGVLARQYKWGYELDKASQGVYPESHVEIAPLRVTRCENCGSNCLWVGDTYIFPDRGNAPRPNPDMPAEVQSDYEEAARIYTKSPRGAAALLRLAIQKLMVHLGQTGKNINEDIAGLVALGLPQQIQQALDVVRVTGNNAVHPGQLDANDTQVAEQLFPLVNVIVEYRISLPARIQEMYDALPGGAKTAIEKRDGAK
ncbi:DUF4145 domain-containing protein [Geobacter sp. AOG1]|uniref:DUF4145 domain-containing protein n=1 Tax=Geobacter sp. AOG1 TaxID=1566346 RepID=UPI001CC691AF|nr:DUF4145 domain-containing protein [Geobacter sp. AOG1]GFE57492.1 hypothetical protein AOG1_13720 [Geobacter sp. AOG1]